VSIYIIEQTNNLTIQTIQTQLNNI